FEVPPLGGPELARDDDLAVRRKRLAGDAGTRIPLEESVEDRVADAVTELVGMARGHGFRREESFANRHVGASSLAAFGDAPGAAIRIKSPRPVGGPALCATAPAAESCERRRDRLRGATRPRTHKRKGPPRISASARDLPDALAVGDPVQSSQIAGA